MGLFGALVGTLIETVTLPVAVVKDAFTMGGVMDGENDTYDCAGTYTAKKLEQIKDEASG